MTTEVNNEPLDADEVENYKDELSIPLEDMAEGDMSPAEQAGEELSDEEFEEMLGGEEEPEDELDGSEELASEIEDEITEEPEDENVEDDEEFIELDTDAILGDNPEEDEEDDIFDEVEPEEDEEVPAEELEDEEDIIISDEEDEEIALENPGMETIEMGDEISGEEATDLFGGDIENPLGEESDLYNPKVETPDFNIVNVMFNSNVNGTVQKSGEVIALRPTIDADGNNHVKPEIYKFRLDGEECNPVIETQTEISTAIYNAIVSSIKQHPQFTEVCKSGISQEAQCAGCPEEQSDEEYDITDGEDWEQEYYDEMSDEDRGIYTIGDEFEEEPEDELNDIEPPFSNNKTNVEDEDAEDDFQFDVFDDIEDDEEEVNDPVMTYKDEDGTEIEFPAPAVDGTEIPESKKPAAKKAVNENRKFIKSVSKTGSKSRFFVNEAAIKASKKVDEETVNISAPEKIDGNGIETISHSGSNLSKTDIKNKPIEHYKHEEDTNTIEALRSFAKECSSNSSVDVFSINVSEISSSDFDGETVEWFTITDNDTDKSYVVYSTGLEIFYRKADEFFQIIQDIEDGVPGSSVESLKFDYRNVSEPLSSYTNREDCLFVITSIFSSMTGRSYDSESMLNDSLTESCKIRKHNKLGADTVENSKKFHDAKYGTKKENDFKQEIEAKQQMDGTVGSLDKQEESVEPDTENGLNDAVETEVEETKKPELPNVHKKMDEAYLNMVLEAKAEDICWEPLDHVIVDGERGTVTEVKADIDGTQTVIVMVQGHTIEKKGTEIKLDTDWYKPTYAPNNFELGPDGLNVTPKNEELPKDNEHHRDLNESLVECNIVVDGYKFNFNRQMAHLSDLMESHEYIRVVSEDGSVANWPVENIDVDMEHWPYAVIVSQDDDEPLRKIRVNPVQYCEALDDEYLVDVLVADKLTQIAKKHIKIIS